MKPLTIEQKKEKAIVEIINKMFEIAGHNVTYEDIRNEDKWYDKYTMTFEHGEQLKEWGKQHLMKELKIREAFAEKEMHWFNVMWGLKYSDFDQHIKGKLK
jgi:hypothetical protein